MEDFIWDMGQERRIRGARRDAEGAARDATRARQSIAELENTVSRLTLVCQAMWGLLKQSGQHTEEDLLREMARLDAADGVVDGKATPGPVTCPSCGRANSRRRTSCLYCGTDLPDGSAFDRV